MQKVNIAPTAEYDFIDLPETTLHYLKTGNGPPLILVPALVSKISQWAPMAQFMGQKFTTYFFELPGHGGSTAYPNRFQSQLVPKTIESFLNKMNIDRFTLMGASFGGLLAMRTLDYLLPRIDQVVILCPALSYRAITLPRRKQLLMKLIFGALKYESIQRGTINLIHGDSSFDIIASAIAKFSTIDKRILIEKELKEFPQTTLDVLAEQLNEVLRLDYDSPNKPFQIPCFYGMSLFDNLLDYDITLDIVENLFSNIHVETFDMPYHQPPIPFTYEDYNEQFGHFLENIETINN